jgi:hypothetical protein
MALTFFGETDFVQSGQPQWTQSVWDFDNLVIPYSGAITNLNSFLDGLEVGQPSDLDDDMVLANWRVSGSKQYPVVELVYTGKKNGILPPVKRQFDDAVMSASSQRTSDGTILNAAATVEYYAPTSVISYISLDGPGTTVAPPPSADPRVISFTVGDTSLSIGGPISTIVSSLFQIQTKQTFKSSEIVPDKYWQNESTTTKVLSPWVFDVTSGAYLILYSPGNGYAVGNTLTVSSGGQNAVVVVDSVFGAYGGTGILDWHETSNSFTVAHNALPASGGSGSGAGFNVVIVP